ncbi:MAG: DUF116 domain-containing protein [Clostridia bacterium]|nr:DUF116 domain-containing protein [Clostridia bacterium]
MPIKKRLFVALLAISVVFLGGLAIIVWYLLTHQGILLNQIIFALLIGGAALFLVVIGLGILFLVLALWSAGGIQTPRNMMLLAVNSLFPLALTLGQLVGIDREKIRASFIAVNNQLVHNRGVHVNPQDLLILAPHCLQWSGCPHKITMDVNNCKGCGKCPIDDLRRLADTYGVQLAVVTGGTLARSFVRKHRPKAIVAVACERDLTSGIQDVKNVPVMGILNSRPQGPCFNTLVDIKQVEESLREFLGMAPGKNEEPRGINYRLGG